MPELTDNPLKPLHDAVDAEMQPYDRLEIVSTFGEPQVEYAALRKAAGLMDLPQRGVLEFTGKDRLSFLNSLISNKTYAKDDKRGLDAGEGVYAYLLNLKGRIACDFNVLERGDRTLLELDVRLVEPMRTLFDRYLFAEQVKMRSLVNELHEIALYGPNAPVVLGEALFGGWVALRPMQSVQSTLNGVDVIVWRDDATGPQGLHVLVPKAKVAEVWTHLLERFGKSKDAREYGQRDLRPVGWAAFNTCRIENGRPLFGIDIEPAAPSLPGKKVIPAEAEDADPKQQGVLPAETGEFERAVSVVKGCYLGQEVVARMHARRVVARQIVGFRMDADALPMAGTPVLDEQNNTVGVVTSSTVSPILSNACIGLALVRKPWFEVGKTVRIPAEGDIRAATVVKTPFLKRDD